MCAILLSETEAAPCSSITPPVPPPSRHRRLQDRGTRLPIPTVARKHLPPPPVGETMGHGLSPPRDRGGLGLGAGASVVSALGSDAGGGPSPPGSYLSNYDNGRSVAGRKRRVGDGGGENGRSTLPRRGGGGEGAGRKEFPALPGQHRQRPFLASTPVEADGGVPVRGGGGEGGGGKGRRSGSALRMGWVSSRRSQGTLQELLRTT